VSQVLIVIYLLLTVLAWIVPKSFTSLGLDEFTILVVIGIVADWISYRNPESK